MDTTLAQRFPNERVHELLVEANDLGLKHHYDAELGKYQQIVELDPTSPLGYVNQAAVLQAKNMDYEVEIDGERIKSLLDKGVELARTMLKKETNNPWGFYFLGTAFGYYANYYARSRSWILAVNYAYKAKKEFERCIEADSAFYDVYAGLGTFRYWRSRKTEAFNWLPFLGDDREEGIRLIKVTIEKGLYNKYLAIHSLVWILIDAGQYAEAKSYCELALRDYPNSRFFLWALARSYEDVDFGTARELYRRVLASVRSEKTNNHYSEVVLLYIVAKLSYRMGEYATALETCQTILSFQDLDAEIKDRLTERIELTRKLMSDAARGLESGGHH
jgi:tetratricopeptide (TPR) repeat protein